jgi:hypothetical protein
LEVLDTLLEEHQTIQLHLYLCEDFQLHLEEMVEVVLSSLPIGFKAFLFSKLDLKQLQ